MPSVVARRQLGGALIAGLSGFAEVIGMVDLPHPTEGGGECRRCGVGVGKQAVELLPSVLQLAPDVRLHLGERWLELASGERLAFSTAVATIGLPALLDIVLDEIPEELVQPRKTLRWVRVLNIALGVRGPAPVAEHWRYFPDPGVPYYRVGFPSNHGRLAPDGCHTVSVEISFDPATGDVEAVAADAEDALVRAGLVDPEAVEVRRLTMVDPAYVVFDHERRQAVSALRGWLGSHSIRLSGRWAEWKYSAMEDAILDGMAAARRLLKGAD